MITNLIKETYSFSDFIDIIAALRSEEGCPWDKEQTHESLKPCMMEEAAELVASIRIYDKTGNYENFREELGDILLQVVMHSQIAKEEGIFQIDNVIQEVCEKMIRRHPHVFGTIEANNSSEALHNWEEIKKQEKEGKDWMETPLRDIPKELPSLTRTTKVLKKADKLYQQGNTKTENLNKLSIALEEMKQTDENDTTEVNRILGDMLFCITDISRICKVFPEQILMDRVEEFIDKFE